MAKVMHGPPEPDSPMWWRRQEHEHVPAGVGDKAGPPYCALCWVELEPLTYKSTGRYR